MTSFSFQVSVVLPYLAVVFYTSFVSVSQNSLRFRVSSASVSSLSDVHGVNHPNDVVVGPSAHSISTSSRSTSSTRSNSSTTRQERHEHEGDRRVPVYVYDLVELFSRARRYSGLGRDVDVWQVLREAGGAIPENDTWRAGVDTPQTDQWNLWPHILRGLARSTHFRPTRDPDRAELFLVPLFPYSMTTQNLHKYCETVTQLSDRSLLPHLRADNANRHVIVLAKSHSSARGQFCDPFWASAIEAEEGGSTGGGAQTCDHPLCEAQKFSLTMSYRVVPGAGVKTVSTGEGVAEEDISSLVPGAATVLLHQDDRAVRMRDWASHSRMQPKPACAERETRSTRSTSRQLCRAIPDGRVVALPYLASVVRDQAGEDGRAPCSAGPPAWGSASGSPAPASSGSSGHAVAEPALPRRVPRTRRFGSIPWREGHDDLLGGQRQEDDASASPVSSGSNAPADGAGDLSAADDSGPAGQTGLAPHKRDVLVSYAGKPHGLQESWRKHLHELCRQNPRDCILVTSTANENNFLVAKRRSVFCLEPEGDTPFRKSLFDTLLSGCIPVLFSRFSDNMAPVHMGDWRTSARLVLDPKDFLPSLKDHEGLVAIEGRQDRQTREPKDLLEYLRGVPADRIAAMQRAIADHAHSLNWGVWRDGAVDRFLRFAHARADAGTNDRSGLSFGPTPMRGDEAADSKPICVSVAASADQTPGLLQLTRSLAKHTEPDVSVDVHVWALESEAEAVASEMRGALKADLEKAGNVRLTFEAFSEADIAPYQNKHSDRENLSDPHNYVRFLLPARLLSSDDCLWLDADVLTLRSLRPVRDFVRPQLFRPPRGPPPALAAFPRPTEDPVEKEVRESYRQHGFLLPGSEPDYPAGKAPPTSFNAGVLWLNLKFWRAQNLDAQVRKFCQFNAERKLFTWFGSNPPLSLLFGGERFLQLPGTWMLKNLGWQLRKNVRQEGREAVFAHWNGKKKPWLPAGAYVDVWKRMEILV